MDMSRSWLLFAVAAMLLGRQEVACAHKLKIFATAEGKTISGYAYLSGGDRPRHVTIHVQGPKGEKLGEVTTNEKGEFTYEAKCKCDHVLVLEMADGHGARFTVRASELPDDLPAPSGAPAAPKPAVEKAPVNEKPAVSLSGREIEDVVEKAVSKQIRPLREQIEGYEERVRWHDVLGGIGYIIGIAGIVFYFLGIRKRQQ